MKRLFANAVAVMLLALAVSPAHAQAPYHVWSQCFGGTAHDIGYAITVDRSGNVLVAGTFSGTVNFGGGDLVSAGGEEIFVAKYNLDGVHQWSRRFGSTGDDAAYSVAVNPIGDVLVTGRFQGTVSFGGVALTSAGDQDIFLAKYNADGVHLWSKRFGSTLMDIGWSVAMDRFDNVLLAGYFQGTVNFGGANLVSAGGTDIFVAKYNPNGVHQWSKRFGGTSSDVGYTLAVDGAGNVVLAGYFMNTVNLGGANLVSAGDFDIFMAKYNSAGVHLWSKSFGSILADRAWSVAVDAADNVLMTGRFYGTVNFGGADLVSAGVYDIFLAKYNSAGLHLWSQRFGSSLDDNGWSVATDESGNVLTTGYFQGTANLGGSDLVSAGGQDIYVAKYNPDGLHQWSRSIGSTNLDCGWSVAVDPWKNVLVTGRFYGTVNCGGADLVGVGGMDVFVAKFRGGAPTGVGETPGHYSISISAYPNPFNPQTTIRYTVPSKGHVSIDVYDARGAHIATLFDGERGAGAYQVDWDGRAAGGTSVSSGVYFARVTHTSGTGSYKLVVVR